MPSWAEGLLGTYFPGLPALFRMVQTPSVFLDISCGFAGAGGKGKASCHPLAPSLTCAASGLKPRKD